MSTLVLAALVAGPLVGVLLGLGIGVAFMSKSVHVCPVCGFADEGDE